MGKKIELKTEARTNYGIFMWKRKDMALKAMKVHINQNERSGRRETLRGYKSPTFYPRIKLLNTEQISYQVLEQPILLRWHTCDSKKSIYIFHANILENRKIKKLFSKKTKRIRLSQDSFSFKNTLCLKDGAISHIFLKMEPSSR